MFIKVAVLLQTSKFVLSIDLGIFCKVFGNKKLRTSNKETRGSSCLVDAGDCLKVDNRKWPRFKPEKTSSHCSFTFATNMRISS